MAENIRKGWLLPAAVALIAPVAVAAHHGWGWATEQQWQLTGSVVSVDIRNPHGTLIVKSDDVDWEVEIGQPWRNERAGLSEEILSSGTRVRVHGHRSSNFDERLMKAERVRVGRRYYNLYPDRES